MAAWELRIGAFQRQDAKGGKNTKGKERETPNAERSTPNAQVSVADADCDGANAF